MKAKVVLAFSEINKSYAGQDVIGFTKVMANPLKIYYSLRHNGKSSPAHD